MTGFPDVPVIDAHHHFWALDRFPYRWLAPDTGPARFGDKAGISRDYLPPDYRTDMAGVDLVGSVHVQANCGAADPVEETRWLDDVARATGWPSAIVAEVDLTSAEAPDQIARHRAASSRLRGVRTPVAWDEAGRWRVASRPGVLADPAFRRAAQTLCDAELVLEMVVVPSQLPEVGALARALPELQIVINHFGTLELDQAEVWRAGISDVSTHPNIALKLSGLWTVDRNWDPKTLSPYILHALACFSADRIMYGSNMPVEGVNCGVAQHFESLSRVLSDAPAEVLQAMFHGTAKTVYRLE